MVLGGGERDHINGYIVGDSMNNIKTIADFKRAMLLGTTWEATHEYTDNNPTPPKNLGIREVGVVRTTNFGFKTGRNTISYCDWPKKSEFSTEDNGNVVVITTGFCKLRYRQTEGAQHGIPI
jgi:hypothetical protein